MRASESEKGLDAALAAACDAARSAEPALRMLWESAGAQAYVGLVAPDGTYEEHYTGPGLGELLGRPELGTAELHAAWREAVHPEDRAAQQSVSRNIAARDAGVAAFRLRQPDGSWRWVEDRMRVRERFGGHAVVEGAVIDVHARHASETAAAQARMQLTTVLATIEEHLFTVAFDATGAASVVWSGPGFERISGGHDVREAANVDYWMSVAHPDDRSALRDLLVALASGRRADLEFRFAAVDGELRWVWARGAPRRGTNGEQLADVVLSDVSERHRDQIALAAAVRERDAILRALPDIYFRFSADGVYRDAWGDPKMLLVPRARFIGKHIRDVLPPHVAGRLQSSLDSVHRSGAVETMGYDLEFGGEQRNFEARLAPLPNGDVVALVRDTTERRRIEAELERLARVDQLTSAANRAYFRELVASELARAEREGSWPGLLVLDCDHFKAVNDRLGHRAGDDVLVELVARVREASRPYDLVGRLGGDEFALLVPGILAQGPLDVTGERVCAMVRAEPFPTAVGPVAVTVSVGVALAGPGATVDALFDVADLALYAAKQAGRDRAELSATIAA